MDEVDDLDDKAQGPGGGEPTRSTNIGNLLLVKAGVTPTQLSDALREQERSPGRRIGEILIAMGHLAPQALKDALKKQAHWRKHGPSAQDVKDMANYACDNSAEVVQSLDGLRDDLDRAKK